MSEKDAALVRKGRCMLGRNILKESPGWIDVSLLFFCASKACMKLRGDFPADEFHMVCTVLYVEDLVFSCID